ncbi:OsmC family protein [Agaribacterium sp. ZY112]|uniref:OsmC family protein n=1 Tax=Agaribacterium sp. ZY112 TaxID=3233574 RepID=UPI003523A44D
MSTYQAQVKWQRAKDEGYIDNKYSRAHLWQFDGGLSVAASSSPHIVPEPYSVAANVDPEEAFIASISSCHMLFFLSIAAKRGFIVDSYLDKTEGYMGKDQSGCISITQVRLNPHIIFSADTCPSSKDIDNIHHQAHQQCFIANSVKAEIIINSTTS